jgi:hypothetical protein
MNLYIWYGRRYEPGTNTDNSIALCMVSATKITLEFDELIILILPQLEKPFCDNCILLHLLSENHVSQDIGME